MKNKLKTFCLSLLYIIIFLIIYVLLGSFFSTIFASYGEIAAIIVILIIYALFKKNDLKKDLKNINKTNYKKHFLIFLIMFIITNLASRMFPKIFHIMVTNQAVIEENINIFPLRTFISTVLLAPIYEEILFRKNFKEAFSSKWLFIICTGIIFGVFHVLTISKFIELVYLPLYIYMGITLGTIYYNDDNILSSMKYHFLNNLLTFMIILFF